jgi:hypothetical protein
MVGCANATGDRYATACPFDSLPGGPEGDVRRVALCLWFEHQQASEFLRQLHPIGPRRPT